MSLPTVVFLPHFGGNHLSHHHHQEMVRTLGFPTVAIDLTMDIYHLRQVRQPVIDLWVDELQKALAAVPGPKILYTFSFPSITVPALLARQPREDIHAWIADGGPFMELWTCIWNYFTHEQPTHNPVLHFAKSAIGYFFIGGFSYQSRVRHWLKDAGLRSFPILSLRAGSDLLVPDRAIAEFFALTPKLNPEVVRFPGAGHLGGLRTAGNAYHRQVAEFLKQQAIR